MPPQQSIKPRRSIETISVWVLIASLVVAVFAFIPSASVSFMTTKSFVLAAGALLAFAAYVLARLSRGNVILPPFLLVGALWFPVIAYVLSAAFSGVPFMNALWGSSLETDTLGFMLAVAIFGTLTALVLRRSEHYRTFLRTSVFAFAALVVVQALILIVGQFAPSTVSPSFSPVGSVNDLASILGLGVIGILIALRELDVDLRARRILLACVVLALALLAVANVALVWTLLALVSLGFFVESVMRRGDKGGDTDLADVSFIEEEPLSTNGNNRPLVMPLVVLAVSLFFLIGGTLGNALASALNAGQVQVRPSWQSTLSVGQKVFSSTPVLGSGPGTFGVEWLKYRDASLNATIFWNVDFSSGIGFIPTSFVTTGLVGGIAWIALLTLFIVFGLRMLIRRAPEDAFIRFVAFFSFLASVYLFTITLFDLPGAVVLALAFVFAGLFASTMRFSSRGGQWGVIFARSPRLGFIIVFVLTVFLLGSVALAYTLVGRAVASYQLGVASNAFAAGNLDAADTAARSSASFASTARTYQLQAGIARARLGQIASSTTMPAAAAQKAFQDALSSGITAALASTNLSPSDYQGWLMLGDLYAQAVPLSVTGAYDGAKAAYEKAQALNPTNPQIPYIIAELNIANKDYKAAQENLKAAIALKQDYTTAILLLSQLEVQDGNVKEALNSALAAAYFTPNDPSILFQIGILYAVQSDLTNAGAALEAAVSANPQFANARYFLAAVYAKRGDLKSAQAQVQAIADMSADNAKAVASQLAALATGTNPFPANLLSVSSTPVK
ncbi:MAG: tetratricopeptide repeat protein [Candidatus Pacebacteria bacterium]|nr:tetratricopeptide repeat protein [Candidatus Paceibacterota bacterium]